MLIAFLIVPILAGATFCGAFLIAFKKDHHAWASSACALALTLVLLSMGPSFQTFAIGTPMEVLGSLMPAVTMLLIAGLWMTGSYGACMLKRQLLQL